METNLMKINLSNELFVVGVSLDCLRAGVSSDSFLDNRLSALSGQVLSDSKKIEELESKLDLIRDAFDVLLENNSAKEDFQEDVKAVIGDRLFSYLNTL